MIRAAGIVAASLALLTASSAQALTLTQVGGTFAQPTYVTSEPTEAGRLFVAERKGTIQLLKGGVSSQFADIRGAVGCGSSCQGERGLLSLAPDPDFAANGRLFVAYANDEDGAIHLAELVAGPGRESADSATLEDLLVVPHPDAANHNGGQIQFGPDGFLYLSTGDGGGSDDEFHHAQDPGSQLGKILRIDPDAAVPTATIWSLGLRNPYRFSFDSLNGDMVIGDVGQSAREEIDFAPSPLPGVVGGFGANYGWNCREGLVAGPATDPQCASLPPSAFTPPVFEYRHDSDPDLAGSPARCSVTGGYVVRDTALGALYGRYLYSDYCGGGLRALRLPDSADGRASEDCSLKIRAINPVSFGEDAARRLYVVEQGGRIYRLGGEPPAGCPPAPPAAPPQAPATAQVRIPEPTVPSYVGIQAQRRRVERGRRALLTVWVSPCSGRRGQLVQLRRNGNPFGSRYLSRACTARFLPKIRNGTTFAAVVRADETYLPGESRQLTIKLAQRQRR
ncbi:MAG TPA: PQQ-dependent sugar dehydrogenase [Solirubrobacterales bacterium]|nr:PQQ-dependent sugar dehydrogenase [Solirubrobacterales bacterium]